MQENSMNFGYVRVSTKEQNVDRQIEELKKYNIPDRNIYIDKASGRNFNREDYNALKRTVRKGDSIYFHELDRLGRNKEEIKKELKEFKEMGVITKFLDIPSTLIDFKQYGDMEKIILDMVNNLLIEVFSTLAESEMIRTKKRQREGIEAAKAKGIHLGRPKYELPDNFNEVVQDWKNGNIRTKDALIMLEMKKSTFYKYVNLKNI